MWVVLRTWFVEEYLLVPGDDGVSTSRCVPTWVHRLRASTHQQCRPKTLSNPHMSFISWSGCLGWWSGCRRVRRLRKDFYSNRCHSNCNGSHHHECWVFLSLAKPEFGFRQISTHPPTCCQPPLVSLYVFVVACSSVVSVCRLFFAAPPASTAHCDVRLFYFLHVETVPCFLLLVVLFCQKKLLDVCVGFPFLFHKFKGDRKCFILFRTMSLLFMHVAFSLVQWFFVCFVNSCLSSFHFEFVFVIVPLCLGVLHMYYFQMIRV